MYDIIGDIHGHADALTRLLRELGYAERGGCWRHPERTAIFVGDFVDRGPEIPRVLAIVRAMLNEQAALAVMGNHEFNTIAFHRRQPSNDGSYLRQHTPKNAAQCAATLAQLSQREIAEALRWFRELPMWLDLDGLRIVHACWDPAAINAVADGLARHGGVTDGFMVEASDPGSDLFAAVEVVLKGKEHRLPDGLSFRDKDNQERCKVRTRWFLDPRGRTWREYAVAFRPAEREQLPDSPVPQDVLDAAVSYPQDAPPVFFGHYWVPGTHKPAPMTPNVACLDYSVAAGGKLCAYRWNGEAALDDDGFVAVPAAA